MKKITLKIAVFLFIAMSAFQSNAQEWTKEGWYTIGAQDTDLLMTIDGATLTLIWAAPKTGADANLQEFRIVNHRAPASDGLMEITADVTPGPGILTMTTNTEDPTIANPEATTGEKRALSLAIKLGGPKEVEELTGDYSGLDQFQRRKTPVDENGNALPVSDGGANPAGNNSLFLRTPWDTGSRFGVTPVEGAQVQFDNGALDVVRFNFVRDVVLSTKNFDASSLSITNPVNDNLVIKGINSDITSVSVYNLLGSKVLTQNITGNSSLNVNVSNLVSGMYIVKLEGANGAFSKKIIKQ